MGVWKGVNAEATINSGLAGLYAHNARLEWQEPEFDVTGSGHKNQVTTLGDRQIRVRLTCSHNGSTPAAILPGSAANLTLKIDTTGTAYTDDYVVQSSPWEQEHRGGGPPQVFQIILTPHDENASNQTVTTGIWA
jgi:hypothetical protein